MGYVMHVGVIIHISSPHDIVPDGLSFDYSYPGRVQRIQSQTEYLRRFEEKPRWPFSFTYFFKIPGDIISFRQNISS